MYCKYNYTNHFWKVQELFKLLFDILLYSVQAPGDLFTSLSFSIFTPTQSTLYNSQCIWQQQINPYLPIVIPGVHCTRHFPTVQNCFICLPLSMHTNSVTFRISMQLYVDSWYLNVAFCIIYPPVCNKYEQVFKANPSLHG